MDATAHERFAAVVEPHLPALRGYVARRDPELADEVMSEVGVVAWRRLDDLPPGHERAWLFGVVRTVLLAERRKRGSRHAAESGDSALEGLAAEPGLSDEVSPSLAEALRRLGARDRELLLLTAWEGLSTGEAAGILEIRPAAARMGLVRARRRLAAALDDLDPTWRRHHLATPPRSTPPQPTPQEVPSCVDAEH